MKKLDCTSKKKEARMECEETNMVRDGVLDVMRRTHLMDASMDPDIHPFPSRKTKLM
jgi:hypothetical protein